MIELDCPGCDHHLRIANKYAGKEGKCRYCRTPFFVPMEIIETPSDVEPISKKKSRKKKASIRDGVPPLPRVALLSKGKEAAIEDSIFATPPESTATADLFEAHANETHVNEPHHERDTNSGGLYWLKYISLALFILVVLGLLAFTQL